MNQDEDVHFHQVSQSYIDEYGRAVASAVLNVADGKYKAEVIIESIKPISFLLR